MNHFEYHKELSRKTNLFENMKAFSDLIQENVFNYLPITFCITISPDSTSANLHAELKDFLAFYNALEANKDKVSPIYAGIDKSVHKPFKGFTNVPIIYEKREATYTRYRMPLTHFIGHNMWLLKPTNLNRGRDIHIFQSLAELKRLLLEYNKQKSYSFVLQKYIEAPLLIHDRKFDIRVWVLVTHEMNCYLFKEGYIRTSSSKFILDENNMGNKFVHLTNNAIQIKAENYGEYEDGNQMSFSKFQSYLDKYYPYKKVKVDRDILAQIKNVVRKSMLAVKRKLNSNNRKYSFEIFGYDFLVDADFNTWLIEVNTNPCLEESSEMLKSLLNRMIDNAFKLTVDVLFPPMPQYMSFPKKVYPVEGYTDDSNLWYFLP